MEEICQLVFTGQIKPDTDQETVETNLCQLLKKDLPFVKKLFEKAPLVIKKNVTHVRAEQIQHALHQAGALCRIEKVPADHASDASRIGEENFPQKQKEPAPEYDAARSEADQKSVRFDDILERYRKKLNIEQLDLAPDIGQERMLKAEIYIQHNRNEDVLCIIDTSARKNMKKGLVLTNRQCYYHLTGQKPQFVPLCDIQSMGVAGGLLKSVVINDGQEICDISAFLPEQQQAIFELLREIVSRAAGRDIAQKTQEDRAAGKEEVKRREPVIQVMAKKIPDSGQSADAETGHALDQMSFEELAAVFGREFWGTHYQNHPDFLNTLLKSYYKNADIEEEAVKPVVLFNAGKDFNRCEYGLLITDTMLYSINKRKAVRKQGLGSVQAMLYTVSGSQSLHINGSLFFELDKDHSGVFPHLVQLLMFRCGLEYNKAYMKKMISRKTHWSSCPQCHSKNIKSGFGYGKGFVATMIASAVTGSDALGLLFGGVAGEKAGKAVKICNKCKHKWKPGLLPNPFDK